MNKDKAVEWLIELSKYFETKALNSKEDVEFQSCQQNSINAIKIAKIIQDST